MTTIVSTQKSLASMNYFFLKYLNQTSTKHNYSPFKSHNNDDLTNDWSSKLKQVQKAVVVPGWTWHYFVLFDTFWCQFLVWFGYIAFICHDVIFLLLKLTNSHNIPSLVSANLILLLFMKKVYTLDLLPFNHI